MKNKDIIININEHRIVIQKAKYEACIVTSFTIDDKPVKIYKLGKSVDADKKNAPISGCGNRIFIPNDTFFDSDVIAKEYGMTLDELAELKEELIDVLLIGRCEKCR